jgi:hypothetical protein
VQQVSDAVCGNSIKARIGTDDFRSAFCGRITFIHGGDILLKFIHHAGKQVKEFFRSLRRVSGSRVIPDQSLKFCLEVVHELNEFFFRQI